jgi:UDP-N-acetylmuramate dehydrogenase
MKIQENIKLAPYTTYKIGGPTRYFVEAKTKKEVLQALKFTKDKNLKYFVLCGGSNVLFSDEGYDGLVIKLCLTDLKVENDIIYAESGVKLMTLINKGIENNLTGLEFLAGVPGEVGGAIRGNAGAFGQSISNFVEKVEAIENGKIVELKKEEIKFDYRDSKFKRNKDIILAGYFKLEKGDIAEAKKEIEKNINYRKENHPWEPSAGSVFKNPQDKSVGVMVEELGLKGYKVGHAQISEKHGNFIINLGGAKASDVKRLIELAKKKIEEKYKVNLEEEIMMVE